MMQHLQPFQRQGVGGVLTKSAAKVVVSAWRREAGGGHCLGEGGRGRSQTQRCSGTHTHSCMQLDRQAGSAHLTNGEALQACGSKHGSTL